MIVIKRLANHPEHLLYLQFCHEERIRSYVQVSETKEIAFLILFFIFKSDNFSVIILT
jgi:hypothetical protein